MSLPSDFQFSQRSLQDYVDCPRRFQYRYVLRVAWPALQAESPQECERLMRLGASFHRLVHQHVLGLPPERLLATVIDDDLRRWWNNYLAWPLPDLPASRYPEVVLNGAVGDHQLVAKLDLVAVSPGRRAVIVDWKTSRRRPRREWLAGRLQTRVYPYLMVRAGADLNGGQALDPGQVEMAYWFANFPSDPECFPYDAAQYRADEAYLKSLIEEIRGRGDEDFPLTAQRRHCATCVYRSLCQRGLRAGALDEVEDEPGLGDDLDVGFDFEQIAEVKY